jgi:hypothetical protein
MLFGNYLFSFCKKYHFLCVILAYHARVLPEAARKSYTSQHVLKLKRFEVGAYAVSDRLTVGITGVLGHGVYLVPGTSLVISECTKVTRREKNPPKRIPDSRTPRA